MFKILISLCLISACATRPDPLADKIKQQKSRRTENMTPEKKKVVDKMKQATEQLRETGIEERALNRGVKVPEFTLGGKKFSEIYQKQPVILKFYRGHWCPYCMLELQEYQKILDDIKQAGGKLIALVPDQARYIRKTKKKYGLTFPIFRDADNKIAKKFGLAFQVSDDIVKIYRGFGIDLKDAQGNSKNELPMPGTYVIDTDGTITYAFFAADYTKRANPLEVLEELQALKP